MVFAVDRVEVTGQADTHGVLAGTHRQCRGAVVDLVVRVVRTDFERRPRRLDASPLGELPLRTAAYLDPRAAAASHPLQALSDVAHLSVNHRFAVADG